MILGPGNVIEYMRALWIRLKHFDWKFQSVFFGLLSYYISYMLKWT
jgi:hypothetical protein